MQKFRIRDYDDYKVMMRKIERNVYADSSEMTTASIFLCGATLSVAF